MAKVSALLVWSILDLVAQLIFPYPPGMLSITVSYALARVIVSYHNKYQDSYNDYYQLQHMIQCMEKIYVPDLFTILK